MNRQAETPVVQMSATATQARVARAAGEGRAAYAAGLDYGHNPYAPYSRLWSAWDEEHADCMLDDASIDWFDDAA